MSRPLRRREMFRHPRRKEKFKLARRKKLEPTLTELELEQHRPAAQSGGLDFGQLEEVARHGDGDALIAALQEFFFGNPTLDINSACYYSGGTVLHLAAENGQTKAIDYLIRKGAKVHLTNTLRSNAAHRACCCTHRDPLSAIQLLFEKDYNLIDLQGPDGMTCLHLATYFGWASVVTWLLDKGADTTTQTKHGATAWDFVVDHLKAKEFESSPDYAEKTIDLCCAFVQRDARRLGQTLSRQETKRIRKLRNLEIYLQSRSTRLGLFALLEHLSQRNVLEQSCDQIRQELCHSVWARNNQRCRESSCNFETHSHNHRGNKGTEPSGAGEETDYRTYEDLPPINSVLMGEANAAGIPRSPVVSVNDTAASNSWSDSYEETLNDAKSGNSGPNYLSLVMPVLVTIPKPDVDSERAKYLKFLHTRNLLYCRSDKEDHGEFYGSLTLDEYCYPTLEEDVLKRRNNDQSLMRLDEELIMVNQVWIWQAQDVLIFTTLGPIDGSLPISHTDVLLTGYGQIGVYLADLLDENNPGSILDSFETAIVKLAEEVSKYATETGIESIGIDKEKRFFHEINDLREELSMIGRVLSQQDEVWRDFASNAWPDIWANCLSGQVNPQSTDAQRQDQREITRLIMRPRTQIQKWQRRIDQLDEDAERVERSVGIQLDLKRQHTSLQETHATALMSAAAFGFAVITIIFTPLSFAMSLFALPIDRLQSSQVPSPLGGDARVYSTTYIGTWTAITELVSVALTLAATWLALEYGLQYRITKNTWVFLKTALTTAPNGMKVTFKDWKQIMKHPKQLWHRKPKKGTDEENRDFADNMSILTDNRSIFQHRMSMDRLDTEPLWPVTRIPT